MKSSFTIVAATSAFALLSACGSGSAGGGTAPPSTGGGTAPPSTDGTETPSYETLDSDAATTSTLGGVALRLNESTGVLDLQTVSGTTTHDTGATTVTDGTYTLTDPDGLDENGVLTDGEVELETVAAVLETYEYVTVYALEYTSGGTPYSSTGVGGVITSASDVPTTGSATYTGAAGASVATPGQIFILGGTSRVSADFAAGTVDATMTGFTATDFDTGNAVTAPIDMIAVTDMAISGNGFSGGTVAVTNGGTAVTFTGANTETAAQGAFFGFDAGISAPDEVGGIVYQRGDTGAVVGTFVADSGGTAPPPTDDDTAPPPTDGTETPSYETLDSDAATTSTLGGVALRLNESTGVLDLQTVSGTTTHDTGATTVTDGTYTLTDPDGLDENGVLTDGEVELETVAAVLETYEYVTVYNLDYTSGGTPYSSTGVGGVITSASDVPTTGSATYTGAAGASVVTPGQNLVLGGTSRVSADFAAGEVDVTLDYSNNLAAPIDMIEVTDMAISGNGFSGGTVAVTNGGTAVTFTGANTETAAQGAFFGFDAAISAPDEVGGIVYQRGDTGAVLGNFVAD